MPLLPVHSLAPLQSHLEYPRKKIRLTHGQTLGLSTSPTILRAHLRDPQLLPPRYQQVLSPPQGSRWEAFWKVILPELPWGIVTPCHTSWKCNLQFAQASSEKNSPEILLKIETNQWRTHIFLRKGQKLILGLACTIPEILKLWSFPREGGGHWSNTHNTNRHTHKTTNKTLYSKQNYQEKPVEWSTLGQG